MKNDLSVSDLVKIVLAFVLLAVWIAMVYLQVPHSDDIVAWCKLALTGLSAHYLTNYTPTPPAGTTVISTTPPTGGNQ